MDANNNIDELTGVEPSSTSGLGSQSAEALLRESVTDYLNFSIPEISHTQKFILFTLALFAYLPALMYLSLRSAMTLKAGDDPDKLEEFLLEPYEQPDIVTASFLVGIIGSVGFAPFVALNIHRRNAHRAHQQLLEKIPKQKHICGVDATLEFLQFLSSTGAGLCLALLNGINTTQGTYKLLAPAYTISLSNWQCITPALILGTNALYQTGASYKVCVTDITRELQHLLTRFHYSNFKSYLSQQQHCRKILFDALHRLEYTKASTSEVITLHNEIKASGDLNKIIQQAKDFVECKCTATSRQIVEKQNCWQTTNAKSLYATGATLAFVYVAQEANLSYPELVPSSLEAIAEYFEFSIPEFLLNGLAIFLLSLMTIITSWLFKSEMVNPGIRHFGEKPERITLALSVCLLVFASTSAFMFIGLYSEKDSGANLIKKASFAIAVDIMFIIAGCIHELRARFQKYFYDNKQVTPYTDCKDKLQRALAIVNHMVPIKLEEIVPDIKEINHHSISALTRCKLSSCFASAEEANRNNVEKGKEQGRSTAKAKSCSLKTNLLAKPPQKCTPM